MAGGDSVTHPLVQSGVVRRLARRSLPLAIFATGSAIAYAVWDRIELPFSNPLNVVGPLADLRYNPANNALRFLVFISLPSVLLLAMAALRLPGFRATSPDSRNGPVALPPAHAPRPCVRVTLFALMLVFVGLASLSIPTYHASGTFDTFHEGESLGTAVSLAGGLVPYKNFIFYHGFFEDPCRSTVAFALFGRSIGAQRTLQSLLKVAAWILLATVVLVLLDEDYAIAVPALALLALIQQSFSTFFYRHLIDKSFICDPPVMLIVIPRDLTLLIYVLCLIGLHRMGRETGNSPYVISAMGFGLAFSALGAFAYSIDRGFYLTAGLAFAAPTLFFVHFKAAPNSWVFPAAIAAGIASSAALMAIVLRGHIGPFIDFVFLTLPRYKELSDGKLYDIAFTPYLRVALVFALVTFWMAARFVREVQSSESYRKGIESFLRAYMIEANLLLLAVLYFRSALGRADWEHIVTSALPIWLLIVLVAANHGYRPIASRIVRLVPTKKCIRPGSSAFARQATLCALSLACVLLAVHARATHVSGANFPYHTPDENFVETRYRDAVNYLKGNLAPEESIFVLTAEASWYYLIDRPASTRFPVVWFATPDIYQKEIVSDLQKRPVPFVVYKSGYPLLDQIAHEARYPILMDYILKNYRSHVEFDGIEIWAKIDRNPLAPKS